MFAAVKKRWVAADVSPPPQENQEANGCAALLVYIVFGLAFLYGLVKFVKWAWEN